MSRQMSLHNQAKWLSKAEGDLLTPRLGGRKAIGQTELLIHLVTAP